MSSDDENMTVTVQLPPKGSNYDGPTVEHTPANAIVVKDGHLHVQQYSDIVAIYAPGKWTSAVVS